MKTRSSNHEQVIKANVTRNLRAVMGARAMNQTQLSKTSGISQIQVSNILNGKNSPRLSTLNKLAVALGVDARDFFNDEVHISGDFHLVIDGLAS